MKKMLFLLLMFYSLNVNAQNHLVTFAGIGASTTVNTIKIENLTTGTVNTLNGEDVLGLSSTTTISEIESEESLRMKIYPNPITDESKMLIYSPVEGDAIISIYEMTGRPITQIQSSLEHGQQEFLISGLKQGLYIVSVKGKTYQYSKILISNSKSNRTARIDKSNINNQTVDKKALKINAKGVQETVYLAYTTGDILKFTSVSGDYSTVVTAKIEADTTITFNFVACTDGDGNNYPVVNIGGLILMAENLKTTKYNDGTTIPIVSVNTEWGNLTTPGYCWLNNDESTNKNLYGALYNWQTVNNGKLCPDGWHVPDDFEWTMLTDYILGGSAAGAKLKENGTLHWTDPNIATNETGFTAFPGGYRGNDGTFYSNNSMWWSRTEYSINNAYLRFFTAASSSVFRTTASKKAGYSVRCIKGTSPSLIPTDTAINNALLLCYSNLKNYVELTYLFDAIYSDNILAPNSSWNAIDQHTQTMYDSNVLKLWSDAYNIIYKTNHVINSAEIVITDLLLRYQIIAQAKAIRSYVFYNLLTWFNGIPIEGGFSSGMIPRNTIQEVLVQINQDATDAAGYLPLSWPTSEKFRIPKSFAKGLLSRAYLYSKNYVEALNPIADILNPGIYALSVDTNNFSPTNTEVFWCFEKGTNTIFNNFFTKGSFVPGIRYTETILSYAESLFNTGNTENAKTYFNLLRQRRGQPLVTTLTNDDIYKQWKTEMAKEGEMFISLKRFDKALSIVQGMEYRLVLPIPVNALDLNPYLLQNPGY